MSEQIVTGKKYRILTDVAQKVWQRVSFWTKSSDVEFDDGKTAQNKVGAINGITDSLVSNSSNIAASAKAVRELNGNLGNLGNCVFTTEGSGEDTKYFIQLGADTASKKELVDNNTQVLAMFHASSSGITRYTADRRIVGLTMVVEDARESYTVLKVNGINQPEKDIVTISSSIAFGYQTYDIILNPGDEVAVTNRGGGGGDVVLLSGIVQSAKHLDTQ